MIFPPEPSKECVKVSHVIFECRVINHHPKSYTIWLRSSVDSCTMFRLVNGCMYNLQYAQNFSLIFNNDVFTVNILILFFKCISETLLMY